MHISAEEKSVTTDLDGTGPAVNERDDCKHTEERATVVCDAASSKMMCDVEYTNNEQALVSQSSLDYQR